MGEHEPSEPKSATAPRKAVESDLTSDRWQKIKGLFTEAQEREPKDRSAYLRGACGGDDALLTEVESLLAAAASEETATAAIPPAQDALVGRRIGAYKIERQIGSGGMASVYLACRADEEYQKQVAIKILRPELDSKELLRRFRNERQTLAKLDHPHIVKLLDGGSTEEGLPFIVMDYVEGAPIDEFCDSNKLSIEQRLRLFSEVCAGVECAHQNSVSAGETFTMALQGRQPRVVLIGLNTQGVFSDVLNRSLPNGWRFHLPNEVYLTADGQAFDGTGVPPDVRVPFFTGADLQNGRDAALEEAIKRLTN